MSMSKQKWEEDMEKLQRDVQQEGHNLEVQKQQRRQLERVGIEQTQRRMSSDVVKQGGVEEIGLPQGIGPLKQDSADEWHEEKRPARARKADEAPRPEGATRTSPHQGLGLGSDVLVGGTKRPGLRGYFGAGRTNQPDVPQGMVGLEALERLNLTEVDAPSTSVPTGMIEGGGGGGIEMRREPGGGGGEGGDVGGGGGGGMTDMGEGGSKGEEEEVKGPIWKPTVEIKLPQMGGGGTEEKKGDEGMSRPVPGQFLLSKKPKGMEKGEWTKASTGTSTTGDASDVPTITSTDVHTLRPQVTPLENKTPQFEPVGQLQQATRPLPEWKQGFDEGKGQGGDMDVPKGGSGSEGMGKRELRKKEEGKDSGVGVRLGTGMGHGVTRSHSAGDMTSGSKTGGGEGGAKGITGTSSKPLWHEQAMGQCSEWQGGECPHLSSGTKEQGSERGLKKQSSSGAWKQQAMGQCSEWQGGECPHSGTKQSSGGGGLEAPGSDKGTLLFPNVPTTLEGEREEGSGGSMLVGGEAMQAAADLPGAPLEWQGGGGEGKGMKKDEKMEKGKSMPTERPEEVEHRVQSLGGRTDVAQH